MLQGASVSDGNQAPAPGTHMVMGGFSALPARPPLAIHSACLCTPSDPPEGHVGVLPTHQGASGNFCHLVTHSTAHQGQLVGRRHSRPQWLPVEGTLLSGSVTVAS